MTDGDYMEAFGDGEDMHFMIDVDSGGEGPLRRGDPNFDHYACACGVDYYPCPATPIDDEQLEAIGTLLARIDEDSPAPWHVDPTAESPSRPRDTYDVVDRYTEPILTNTTFTQAQFIALSRTLVPRLVAQLQRVAADLERTTRAMTLLSEAMADADAILYPEGDGDIEGPEGIEVIR